MGKLLITFTACVAALGATASGQGHAFRAAPSDAGRSAPTAVYGDAVGDAGRAPDIARVTLTPVAGGLAVDVKLAKPTELGPSGWILFGVDTDRSPFSGGGRGDELLVLTNGEGTTFARWIAKRFTSQFQHHDLRASLSSTDLTFVLSWADLGARAFNFSVATLHQDADLAPGGGVAAYPLRRPGKRLLD